MTGNTIPSPLQSVTTFEANEPPSNAVTVASDPSARRVAPTAVAASVDGESNTFKSHTSDIAPAISSLHRLVTSVSSDDTASETASGTTDYPVLQDQEDEATQIVVNPIASTNSNSYGIVSASGASHDLPVESSNVIATINTFDESNNVEAAPSDTLAKFPVPTDEDSLAAAKMTETKEAVSSREMTAHRSPAEVGKSMTKRIQVASIAEQFEETEIDVIQNALAKKRKSEDLPTKKGQRTKKKAKAPKDHNAPKKNLTAYMHYATYARDYIKSRDRQLKATDVTIHVQRGWDAMTAVERNYWNEKAAADKERYERQLADYKNSKLGKAWQARVDEETRTRKVTSESLFATKPTGSANVHYDAYARSYIKIRNPHMKDVEVTNVVLRGWSVLTAEVRNYWDGFPAAALAESLVKFYQRVDLTVQDVVEAKVSTQETLDDLCMDGK